MEFESLVGKRVTVSGKGQVFDGLIEGYVLPNDDKSVLVLKLDSGYNVAVKKENVDAINVVDEKKKQVKKAELNVVQQNPSLKKVAIISMGGTIASRVDYETGGVSPQFTSEDLLRATPEIAEIAQIDSIALRSTFSENIKDDDWIALTESINKYVKNNYDGIIVAHGTDTLHYSSAAISFMCEELGIPVVFVGAQRSSDRGSSDSAYNLLGALTFCVESKKAGVFIAMHNSIDDNRIAIHLGTKVRKMHSSRRDAFKSINVTPVAYVDLEVSGGKIHSKKVVYNENYSNLSNIQKGKSKVSLELSQEVDLLKFYPGMNPDVFNFYAQNDKALIIEGTGLGHVSTEIYESIKNAIKSNGLIVFMTTQTLYGRLSMNVYTRGRELLQAGVVSLEDMLPETAYVKAKYVLGKTQDVEKIKELMKTNLKGEISTRTNPDAFE